MKSEAAELSAVIGHVYDAAINPALWQEALRSICAFVGGSSAVLFWHDSATERSEALHRFNCDPDYDRLYFEKYLPLNPMFPAASFVDAGVVSADEDIMPRSELIKTRFYKEWIKPQGIMGALAVNLEKGGTRTSLINVRLAVRLTDKMRYRLGLLVPHLQRAVAIGRLFDQKRAVEETLVKTLDHVEAAVFLVSSDGKIAFANREARKLIGEGALVGRAGEVFRAVAPAADRTLRNVFISAGKGDGSVGVRGIAVALGGTSKDRWFAHVLPLTSGDRREAAHEYRAVAAVFIRRSVPNELPPLEGMAKLYRLSASEVRVLDAILKTTGVKAIAELLGISQATVKTHLHNLFRKTKTKRQSELVKLIAGI